VTREQRDRISRAIAEAEEGTTGRIAVRVIPDKTVDAFERAKSEFGRIRLHRHSPANAALILVAPNARRFAVIGDRALHERVGDAFWDGLVKESEPYFAGGDTVAGIRHTVARIGEAFRAHFPRSAEGSPG
jgi:uncharacterized membrane protein